MGIQVGVLALKDSHLNLTSFSAHAPTHLEQVCRNSRGSAGGGVWGVAAVPTHLKQPAATLRCARASLICYTSVEASSAARGLHVDSGPQPIRGRADGVISGVEGGPEWADPV